MSSTIRKQQIEEIKNYNQNINRQALAKTYSQVALWELQRPDLTPIGTETGLKTDENVNNLNLLLNEKLVVLDRVVNTGKLTEKELNVITKFADVVRSYNTLIEPLVNSRYDNSIKTLARSALTRVKQPIVGLIVGFKQLFDEISNFNIKNIKGLVEAFVVYDYINYQIDKEDYKTISIEFLKSRIPQIYSKVPKEIQDLYMLSQSKYEPLRATKFEFETGSKPVSEAVAEAEDYDEEEYIKFSETFNLGELRTKISNLKAKLKKYKEQKDNWIDWDGVIKVFNDLKQHAEELPKKIKTEEQYNTLLHYVVLSLYVLVPPRRNVDYMKMMMCKNENTDDETVNILDLNKKQFIFNVYKTAKNHGKTIIDIPNELMEVIDLYIKHHKMAKGKKFCVPFLVDYNDKPLTNINSITYIINKIFKKKIGSSMLRHIWISNKYGDEFKERQKDAMLMGHSTQQQTEYIKEK